MTFGVSRRSGVLAALAAFFVSAPSPATGQDDGAFSWENQTELSFVSTTGNASASTLGLKGSLTGSGDANTFKLEFGGIRGETTTKTRTASGTVDNFTVSETSTSQLTAESYFARGRYDRSLGPAFVFTGVGWDRNTFAGVQNRYAFVAGLGKAWTDTETGRFKTDVGATYTIQKDVDPAPGADDSFAGVRASVDAMRQITEGTQYISTLVADLNAEDTDDLRADWINSLAFSLSERLAFKTSLQLLFDNQPSLIEVPLLDGGGSPTANVLTPGDEIDTVLTLTLVITL